MQEDLVGIKFRTPGPDVSHNEIAPGVFRVFKGIHSVVVEIGKKPEGGATLKIEDIDVATNTPHVEELFGYIMFKLLK